MNKEAEKHQWFWKNETKLTRKGNKQGILKHEWPQIQSNESEIERKESEKKGKPINK